MLGVVFMWSSFILPWLSLFFLDGTVIRRYLPAALAITVANTIISQLAVHYNWWDIQKPMFVWSKYVDISLVYGLFPVGSIWILACTADRFLLYMLINLIVDALFAFGGSRMVDRIGLMKLHMTHWKLFLLMAISAVALFIFQRWYENDQTEIRIGTGNRNRVRT